MIHEFLLPENTILTILNIESAEWGQTIYGRVSLDEKYSGKYKIKSPRKHIGIDISVELSHDEIQRLLNTSCILSFFEWWKNNENISTFDYSMDNCLCIEILDWWLNCGLELKYTKFAVDNASGLGRIDILDWWKQFYLKTGMPLLYSESAMTACRNNIPILEWWKNSELELKYNNDVIDKIDINSVTDHIAILNWWVKFNKDSKLPLKYSEYAIDHIIGTHIGHQILLWWKYSNLPMKYSPKNLPELIKLKIVLPEEEQFVKFYDVDPITEDSTNVI